MPFSTRTSTVSLMLLVAITACAQPHAPMSRVSAYQVSKKRVSTPFPTNAGGTSYEAAASPTPTQSSTPAILIPAVATPAWHETIAPSIVPTSAPVAATFIPTLAADAPPRIVGIHIASTVVSPGQKIVGSVTASSNVASVELRIGGYSTTMQKVGVGRFALALTVPQLPTFLLGHTYQLEIIARNTRGDTVNREFPITVQ